jgi:4-amino-4-deoxy-L-arabinose transferase-like glycosyltransferase
VRGRAFALWALLLLALNPWHVLASRWALESNLLPFMLLLGAYLLTLAEERPPMLLASAAAFALSLYAYGAAFIFLPFYLTAASAVFLRRKAAGPRWYFAALALFLL